jgi:hypothetical protein
MSTLEPQKAQLELFKQLDTPTGPGGHLKLTIGSTAGGKLQSPFCAMGTFF